MNFIIKELKTNKFYSGDARDYHELSLDIKAAQKFNYAQAEALCDLLQRQHGYLYKFQFIQAESALYL
jgi:hypothetical protein